MVSVYVITALAVCISLAKNRNKTLKALRIASKRLLKIAPAFLTMLVLVSIALFLIPDALISRYLGTENKATGVAAGALFGSITLMPGFIAFPLCGMLLARGVSYMVLSAFSTTLMTVGVLTYPVERAYFGDKVTILTNVISLVTAIIVAIATGLAFGELF